MIKLNYYAHILLTTKYKILLFLIFYFICIKIHYLDLNFVSCMTGTGIDNLAIANSSKILTTTDYHDMINTPKANRTSQNSRIGHYLGHALSQSKYQNYLDLLNEEDKNIKKYLFELKTKCYAKKALIESWEGTGNCTHKLWEEIRDLTTIHDKIGPYVEHVIEYKQNHERLIQRSVELENTITNLEQMQKPLQDTIQRMQIQDISKIKNIIYDFLPLREENYMLKKRINDLEAQTFNLDFKNKRLIHNINELNRQLLNKDSIIQTLQPNTHRESNDIPVSVSDQLQEVRINIQNLTERLNTQETVNTNNSINNILNSCTTS